MKGRGRIYGVMAEFDTPTGLVLATRKAFAQGYRRMDAYSPFPIEEVSEALGFHRSWVPLVVLIGGLIGCSVGFLFQEWIAAINYPTNIGGRPLNSWPAFIIITFELTILSASICAFIGMLAMNGLPMPYHPVFNAPRFALATKDRFFLCIEARDPKFDVDETHKFLEELGPREVMLVPLEPRYTRTARIEEISSNGSH
jgi:hypothetical protein